MDRIRNYIRGLTTGYALNAVTIGIGLWFTPFSLRFLDREEYAIVALSSDLLMWLNLVDLGISAGLRVHAAQLTGSSNQDSISTLASTAFYCQLVLSVFVLVAGGLLAVGLPGFVDLRPDLVGEARIMLALMVFGAALSMVSQTFSALLIAQQLVYVDNAVSMIMIVVRTIVSVVLLENGWGIQAIPVGHIVARFLTGALAIVRTYRVLPKLRLHYSMASWNILAEVARVSVWFSIGNIAGILNVGLDRLVAAKVVSLEAVTTLSLTGRVYMLAMDLLGRITDTARPMLGQLFGLKKVAEARRAYEQLVAVSSSLGVVAVLALVAANGVFVRAWVGPLNYGGLALDAALGFNLLRAVWGHPNRAILSANLEVRSQTLVGVGEGILNVVLSLFLGVKFGLLGVALGTCFSGVLTSMWMLPRLTAKMFDVPAGQLIRGSVRPLLKMAALLSPVAYAFRIVSQYLGGFPGAGVAVLGTGLCGLGLMWHVALDAETRGIVRDRLALATFRRPS